MKANRELRAKLRHMHQFYDGKLMKCLHPDSKPSDAERSEACGLLGQWKQSADRAPRLRRIAQNLVEFGLGTSIARRCQPSAQQLAIVASFQPLAELLGAVALHCPP